MYSTNLTMTAHVIEVIRTRLYFNFEQFGYPQQHFDIQSQDNYIKDTVDFAVTFYMPGKTTEQTHSSKPQVTHKTTIIRPLTWWDAFKKQYYPQWLLNKFPMNIEEIQITETLIQTHTVSITNIAPQLAFTPQQAKNKYVEFITSELESFGSYKN